MRFGASTPLPSFRETRNEKQREFVFPTDRANTRDLNKEPVGKGRAVSHVPGPIVRHLFRLYRDLLGATGVSWHVDLFTAVCIDDLERGGRIIQPHRLDLGINREGVSDG